MERLRPKNPEKPMRFRQVDNVTRNASELDELLANETYLVKVFAWNGIGRLADGWVGGSWSRERREKNRRWNFSHRSGKNIQNWTSISLGSWTKGNQAPEQSCEEVNPIFLVHFFHACGTFITQLLKHRMGDVRWNDPNVAAERMSSEWLVSFFF